MNYNIVKVVHLQQLSSSRYEKNNFFLLDGRIILAATVYECIHDMETLKNSDFKETKLGRMIMYISV